MNDLGKIAVVAGILGALLLFGIFANSSGPTVVEPVPVVVEQPAAEVTILPQQTLEMLDPVYSEKAIFNDKTIRIAFQGAFSEAGVESRLPFWLHNVSDDVITILWDRCSIQLPAGNTVNVVNEASASYLTPVGNAISIAPAGDLFDAFIPITEIAWTDEGATLTSNVLDAGTFTLVLAIERSTGESYGEMQRQVVLRAEPGCEADSMLTQRALMSTTMSEGREVVYYTFRFILR
ncbi:hypothetical protein IH601_06495 [Candidatus Bipolaricaulota bacterium]|nr:hypothetical protein [Candidatus Bipolaricaulota bacterium]TFH07821.1 MAG: hypothetical protein E4H08_08850 [Candidatus Atribacteria bacterium]